MLVFGGVNDGVMMMRIESEDISDGVDNGMGTMAVEGLQSVDHLTEDSMLFLIV